MIEIERKFLVRSDAYKMQATAIDHIRQGFLNTDPHRTVRIRITGSDGYITVKGITDKSGLRRFEWERPIPFDEARKLLQLCEPTIVEKKRYNVPFGKHIYEVDEFQGANLGLIIAEIELTSEDETFEKPDWLANEVTGDIRYYNSQLTRQPFNTWSS